VLQKKADNMVYKQPAVNLIQIKITFKHVTVSKNVWQKLFPHGNKKIKVG
jgi:hypothetical protein